LLDLQHWQHLRLVFISLTVSRQLQVAVIVIVSAISGPVTHTIYEGQVYSLLALALVLAWCNIPKRPIVAGIFLGSVLVIKPNFIVLLILIAVSRYWLVSVVSVCLFVVVNSMTVIFLGSGIYGAWLSAVNLVVFHPAVMSLSLRSIISPAEVNWNYYGIAIILLIAGIIISFAKKASLDPAFMLGSALSIFLSPVSWVGYAAILYPWLLGRRSRRHHQAALALGFWPFLPLPEPVLESALRLVYPATMAAVVALSFLQISTLGDAEDR
jgi:hypothetical protein